MGAKQTQCKKTPSGFNPASGAAMSLMTMTVNMTELLIYMISILWNGRMSRPRVIIDLTPTL